MKFPLILLVLCFPLALFAQEPRPAVAKSPEFKTEVREFRPHDLHDLHLDMDTGELSFTADKVTYTYRLSTGSEAERRVASAALLDELRHASKLLVRVFPPVSDHVYSQYFTLVFDSAQ